MAEPFPNPLRPLHEQAQAEFQPYADMQVVSTFGAPEAEYAAIRKACGMMDLPQRGLLELTGRDRLPFLNNLLTNQIWAAQTSTGLSAGQGMYAFLLNNKGRIVSDMNVLQLGERTLLEMDARLVEPVRAALDKYLFAEQVKLASRIGVLHQIALHGPGARAVLSQVMGIELPELGPMGSFTASGFGQQVIAWRDDQAAVPGYHLIVPFDSAARVWTDLLSRSSAAELAGKRPLRPVGWAAFNATRVEGGRPIFGIDFDESVLPAETGQLARAVSFTKGCYLGQEIVARMHSRGQLARQLVGVRMAGDALPVAGTKILDDQQNEIGGVTSSTLSPVLSGIAICLAYLRRAFINAGTVVSIPAEGAVHKGVVVDLPFVKPVG